MQGRKGQLDSGIICRKKKDKVPNADPPRCKGNGGRNAMMCVCVYIFLIGSKSGGRHSSSYSFFFPFLMRKKKKERNEESISSLVQVQGKKSWLHRSEAVRR